MAASIGLPVWADARRVARSRSNSLRAASAFASSPRMRLLTVTRSGVLRQADFAAGGGVEGLFPVDDGPCRRPRTDCRKSAMAFRTRLASGSALCNFPDGGHLLGGILGDQTPDLGRVPPPGRQGRRPKGDNTECSDHGAPSAFLCGAAQITDPPGIRIR